MYLTIAIRLFNHFSDFWESETLSQFFRNALNIYIRYPPLLQRKEETKKNPWWVKMKSHKFASRWERLEKEISHFCHGQECGRLSAALLSYLFLQSWRSSCIQIHHNRLPRSHLYLHRQSSAWFAASIEVLQISVSNIKKTKKIVKIIRIKYRVKWLYLDSSKQEKIRYYNNFIIPAQLSHEAYEKWGLLFQIRDCAIGRDIDASRHYFRMNNHYAHLMTQTWIT